MEGATLEEVYMNPGVFEPLVLNHQTKIFAMRRSAGAERYLDVVALDRHDLEVAKANVAALDVVGVMERYDDFLDDVQVAFGWELDCRVRANATPPDDDEPVEEAFLERIRADNALDVTLYEHAARLVELRRGTPAVGA